MTEPQAGEPGHEVSDVHIRGIVWFGVGLSGLCAISAVLLAWLFRAFETRNARVEESRFPLAVEQRGLLPPQPRLEGIPQPSTDAPVRVPKRKPDEFEERLPQAFGKVEQLPARNTTPPISKTPSDANSGRDRAQRNDQ